MVLPLIQLQVDLDVVPDPQFANSRLYTTPKFFMNRTIFKRPYLSEYYELEAQIEVCLSPSSMLPVIRTVWDNFD